ncbi:hypothetical protein [Streptomyces sp. UNOB3_S3]|nr:hypothetical protein [Streptomyces sp. UNOB3_S3]
MNDLFELDVEEIAMSAQGAPGEAEVFLHTSHECEITGCIC